MDGDVSDKDREIDAQVVRTCREDECKQVDKQVCKASVRGQWSNRGHAKESQVLSGCPELNNG